MPLARVGCLWRNRLSPCMNQSPAPLAGLLIGGEVATEALVVGWHVSKEMKMSKNANSMSVGAFQIKASSGSIQTIIHPWTNYV